MVIDPQRVAGNLADVRRRMTVACEKSGRTNDSVKLVAVTKTVEPEIAIVLNSLGINNFGENRVGELVRKAEVLNDIGAEWHMIGHLQRNKVKDLLPQIGRAHV